jgi:hypothetical protein
VRVERLLEDRAREAGVAEALTAPRGLEDRAKRALASLTESVLVVDGELGRDGEQLFGRVVGEDDLSREP